MSSRSQDSLLPFRTGAAAAARPAHRRRASRPTLWGDRCVVSTNTCLAGTCALSTRRCGVRLGCWPHCISPCGAPGTGGLGTAARAVRRGDAGTPVGPTTTSPAASPAGGRYEKIAVTVLTNPALTSEIGRPLGEELTQRGGDTGADWQLLVREARQRTQHVREHICAETCIHFGRAAK